MPVPCLKLQIPVSACQVGDVRSIPVLWRYPRRGNGNPLEYSRLENPLARGAWWATVHRVAKSRTWLKRLNNTDTRDRVPAVGLWEETVYWQLQYTVLSAIMGKIPWRHQKGDLSSFVSIRKGYPESWQLSRAFEDWAFIHFLTGHLQLEAYPLLGIWDLLQHHSWGPWLHQVYFPGQGGRGVERISE